MRVFVLLLATGLPLGANADAPTRNECERFFKKEKAAMDACVQSKCSNKNQQSFQECHSSCALERSEKYQACYAKFVLGM